MKKVKRYLIILVFIFSVFLLWEQILYIPFDHDENHFLAAVHLVDKGLLPYIDFPYNHTPLYPYIALAFYKISSYKFLSLRILSGLAFLGVLIIVFLKISKQSLTLALIFLGTIVFSKLIVFNTCLLRPNNLALFLGLFAFYLLNDYHKNTFFIGLLLSFSTGIRITYALLFLPFRFLINSKEKLKTFYFGLILGCLPIIFFFIKDPYKFIFHTIVQPIKRKTFYALFGYKDYLGFTGRIKAIYKSFLFSPDLIIIFCLLLLSPFIIKFKSRRDVFLILTLIIVLIQCILPAPVWHQYFIPLYIFAMVIFIEIYPLKFLKIIFSICLVINLYLTAPWYWQKIKLNFNKSVPQKIHNLGQVIAYHTNFKGKILTLSTAFPIEGGLEIYHEVPSVFPWREAIFLDKSLRKKYHLYGPEELDQITKDCPPKAILTGLENPWLEKPLKLWAQKHHYQPISLKNLKLWLKRQNEK